MLPATFPVIFSYAQLLIMTIAELKIFNDSRKRLQKIISIDFPNIGILPLNEQIYYNTFYNWYDKDKTTITEDRLQKEVERLKKRLRLAGGLSKTTPASKKKK